MEKKKLNIGDVVETTYDDSGWLCPICGFSNYAYDFVDSCDNCDSRFEDVPCQRIMEIKEVKQKVWNKIEMKK